MIFKTKFQLSFRLADPAQIMFFGNILDIAHDSFEEFIQAAGFSWKEWFNPSHEFACPIRHVEVDFKSPFLPGETYEIAISVERIGETSFTLKHLFIKNDNLHAVAKITHSFMDKKTTKKAPLLPDIKQRLMPFLETENA